MHSGQWLSGGGQRACPSVEAEDRGTALPHGAAAPGDLRGEKLTADITTNYSLMSEDERVKRALELIGIVREITGPRPKPPALRYDPGTEEPEPKPGEIG